jgi:hypothetical protein
MKTDVQTGNVCGNFGDYFIKFQLFIKNNSKTITRTQKHSKSKYIARAFYFLFLLLFIKLC